MTKGGAGGGVDNDLVIKREPLLMWRGGDAQGGLFKLR